jgi:thiaminase
MENFTKTLEQGTKETIDVFDDLPFENIEFYKNYMAQTYYFVIHSVKLLQLAHDHTTEKNLKDTFLKHIQEELGHEKMAQQDLRKMGFEVEQIPELQATKDLYSQIYDSIPSEPLSIFGYATCLENLSAKYGRIITDRVKQASGKQDITYFLDYHFKADQDHTQSGVEFFSSLNKKDLDVVTYWA